MINKWIKNNSLLDSSGKSSMDEFDFEHDEETSNPLIDEENNFLLED